MIVRGSLSLNPKTSFLPTKLTNSQLLNTTSYPSSSKSVALVEVDSIEKCGLAVSFPVVEVKMISKKRTLCDLIKKQKLDTLESSIVQSMIGLSSTFESSKHKRL